jgi:hypothetical protein
LSGTQFSTLKSAGINNPEGQKNITTLKSRKEQHFKAATQHLTPAFVK